ncbi:MAG: cysteine--tRNA ligase [Parcubacteria group bacterium]|nr:cysteine--tRNA ligase [Parcubacteria group bacterium]
MKIFNTLTKQKEELNFLDKKIRMFVCGPTVYDYSHIGHARTYIAFDMIAKYLRYLGYEVFYLQNITDIDDKIIDRAKSENKDPLGLAKEFQEKYMEDMENLGITSVTKYAPATEYIKQIVDQVKRLKEKNIAYLIPDEGYYFDLKRFPDYGKLSGRTVEDAEDAVSRIDESTLKRNKGDFALWKFSRPEDEARSEGTAKPSEPSWQSELGAGRPGWHIEDTAITEKEFDSPQYEIHGGSRDLIFPHHEAEIAQMESLSGKKPFVKLWMHTGFLTLNGQKMSKSLGNFITIRDLLKDQSPEAVRFMVLSTHYRSPIDFNDNLMNQAEAAVMRLREFVLNLEKADGKADLPTSQADEEKKSDYTNFFETHRKSIFEALDDDFNAPIAIAELFNLIREFNAPLHSGLISKTVANQVLDLLKEINGIFGFIPEKSIPLPDEIQNLVDLRETARNEKKFAEADELRKQILTKGYKIDDTPYGPLVRK